MVTNKISDNNRYKKVEMYENQCKNLLLLVEKI